MPEHGRRTTEWLVEQAGRNEDDDRVCDAWGGRGRVVSCMGVRESQSAEDVHGVADLCCRISGRAV